jgi:hypothetical protein
MTTRAVEQQTENQAVARPLKVLLPLIKENLRKAKEVADSAASPYYLSVGEALLEVRKDPKNKGQWERLVKGYLGINPATAWRYMDYAEQINNLAIGQDSTFYQYRKLKRNPPKNKTKFTYSQSENGATNAQSENGTTNAQSERLAVGDQKMKSLHALVKEAFDIGYKKMAHRYHPDKKGGSNEKMKELNEAKRLLYSSLRLIKNE